MSSYFDIKCPIISRNGGDILGSPPAINVPAELNKQFIRRGILVVSARSDMRLKKALERQARYFMREESYDIVQFRHDEWSRVRYYRRVTQTDETLRGFLWYQNDEECGIVGKWPIIGGCCFRSMAEQPEHRNWTLDWIWIHPYQRRKKLLLNAWPLFQSMFGEFNITSPKSKAMYFFLKKVNWRPED